MKRLITHFLNRWTMYNLVVRFLLILLILAAILSYFERLFFVPSEIISTTVYLVVACYIFNTIFARLFHVKPNTESYLITALILALIVGPANPLQVWLPLGIAAAVAMGSKYLVKWRGRHIFNPAALGVVVMTLVTGFGSSWWVGTFPLTLATLVGGYLIIYKIRRLPMIISYLATYLVVFFLLNGLNLPATTNFKLLESLILNSPLFFFAMIMLPEPATSPAGHRLRIVYAVVVATVGLIAQRLMPNLQYALEASLLVGNLLTRLAERSDRYAMTLTKKIQLAPTIWQFIFEPQPAINFIPGQFLEWSVPHDQADSRGTRRWFTIASSPTEKYTYLVTRFAEKSSSYKTALQNVAVGDQIFAHGLEGDFTLPSDKTKPLVFIAGGIGITPFRSMVKYLLDKSESRDIILLFAVKSEGDLIFMDVFNEAKEAFGLKIIPVVSQPGPNWGGYSGQISPEIIKREVPSLDKQFVYVSGPEPMVEAMERMLVNLGVRSSNLKQDFFPGYLNDLLIEK